MKDELKAGIESLKKGVKTESTDTKSSKNGSDLAKQILKSNKEKTDRELTEEIESRPGHGIKIKKFDQFGGEK